MPTRHSGSAWFRWITSPGDGLSGGRPCRCGAGLSGATRSWRRAARHRRPFVRDLGGAAAGGSAREAGPRDRGVQPAVVHLYARAGAIGIEELTDTGSHGVPDDLDLSARLATGVPAARWRCPGERVDHAHIGSCAQQRPQRRHGLKPGLGHSPSVSHRSGRTGLPHAGSMRKRPYRRRRTSPHDRTRSDRRR